MTDTNDTIPATATKIEISINRLALFNSLDPSPFHERDLDHDAEDYIVGSAEESLRQWPLALVSRAVEPNTCEACRNALIVQSTRIG